MKDLEHSAPLSALFNSTQLRSDHIIIKIYNVFSKREGIKILREFHFENKCYTWYIFSCYPNLQFESYSKVISCLLSFPEDANDNNLQKDLPLSLSVSIHHSYILLIQILATSFLPSTISQLIKYFIIVLFLASFWLEGSPERDK